MDLALGRHLEIRLAVHAARHRMTRDSARYATAEPNAATTSNNSEIYETQHDSGVH